MTKQSPPPYRPPLWLPGGHLQTILPHALAPRPRLQYRRERLELPDGDFLDLDWLDGPAESPLLVMFHGLEGNARGYYALALMQAAHRQGFSGVVVHFRGCSGEENRLPRAYFAGDSQEIGHVLGQLHARAPERIMHAAGYSLGGNALLLWLGQQAVHARTILSSAAAISAPINLTAAGNTLDQGINRRLYTRHFLTTLRQKALAKANRYPHLFQRDALAQAATFRAFDDFYTAPAHGFRDAADYWQQAASLPWLARIELPTLLINARNDPFMPGDALPTPGQVSAAVRLEFPDHGGHVGFPGNFPGDVSWLPHRLLHFFRHGV